MKEDICPSLPSDVPLLGASSSYLKDEHYCLNSPNSVPESTRTFRFFDLPLELQVRTLEFTDLSVPGGEIEWYKTYNLPSLITKSWSYDNANVGLARPVNYIRAAKEDSPFAVQVREWRPPTALFLVSKSIGEMAARVFFGRNRFGILPNEG